MPRRKQKPKTSTPSAAPRSADGERLQKVLAAAGAGSRRNCEELILAGRVAVDRQVVTRLGTRVDASQQDIRIDGVRLARPRRVYYLLNKPPGVISTSRDQAARTRVIDLVPDEQRLFTVGRLDMSSEGLILVTNDGELAQRLTHPRYEIEKVYHAEVAGRPTPDALQRLRRGVHLAEAKAQVTRLHVRRRLKQSTVLEIVLQEGRNREIRRIAARIGHKVLSLKRIAMGPLRLGDLPKGAYRELTPNEIRALRRGCETTPRTGSKPRRTIRRPKKTTPEPSPAGRRKTSRQSAKAATMGTVLMPEESNNREGKRSGKRRSAKSAPTKRPARREGRKPAPRKKKYSKKSPR